MDPVVPAVFILVYAGMILGEIPGLRLDRAGVALLGAIALVVSGRTSPEEAWASVDVGTVALLFGLMVVSAQFRLGGFYAALTRAIAARGGSADRLLALVVAASGLLSAFLANDIVCLAMAPVLLQACVRRGLDPVPFLLALAAAANVGSAGTLIGNPQNMLVGQRLGLSFAGYLADGAAPALAGLVVVFVVVRHLYRGKWSRSLAAPEVESPPLDRWQSIKGGLVLAVIVVAFLLAPWPREAVALAAAGLLLTSRRMASRDVLGLVDWQLLILFLGLFVVNGALAETGLVSRALESAAGGGVDLARPPILFGATVVLSNLVSNVPAVMLLLPAARDPLAGPLLALVSTLAGNLLVVGSIANIIVVEESRRLGLAIDWRTHARVGVPVTLGTLAVAAMWLWLRAGALS